jgi:hypothetical protein
MYFDQLTFNKWWMRDVCTSITHLLAHVEICRYLFLEPIPGTKQKKSIHKLKIASIN